MELIKFAEALPVEYERKRRVKTWLQGLGPEQLEGWSCRLLRWGAKEGLGCAGQDQEVGGMLVTGGLGHIKFLSFALCPAMF